MGRYQRSRSTHAADTLMMAWLIKGSGQFERNRFISSGNALVTFLEPDFERLLPSRMSDAPASVQLRAPWQEQLFRVWRNKSAMSSLTAFNHLPQLRMIPVSGTPLFGMNAKYQNRWVSRNPSRASFNCGVYNRGGKTPVRES